MVRLDKVLCDAGLGSRKDCERLVKRGYVTVNSTVVKSASIKISEDDVVCYNEKPVVRMRQMTVMMNKEAGKVTSTEDPRSSTVMEDLPQEFLIQKVLPVGRLDKDTEGLLIFSNDGELIHRLISPKHDVPKVYYVEHDGIITENEISMAQKGIKLKDNSICKSAQIKSLDNGRSLILIREGMYHQVKRMYAAMGLKVKYLKRVQVGGLFLGDLKPGAVRELSEKEISMLSDKNASIIMDETYLSVFKHSQAYENYIKLCNELQVIKEENTI